jgi:Zn-dependent protease with chaperone function
MRRVRAAALLAAALLLSGCATSTITGRSQFMVVSEESAISGSASAYRSMVGGLYKKGKVETGTARAQRVKEITDKLIAQAVRFRPDSAAWSWQVEVINEPKVVNAFCMAGGKMAIYTGFWEKLRATDDEVAAVMGHEIGHALASHTRERMSVAYTTQAGALVLAALLANRNDPNSFARNADALSGAAALAITLPNSREGEAEADQIGIELAARAGFDPRAAVTLWQKMQKESRLSPPQFLSTHPSNETRIQNLSALVPKVDHLYQLARAGKTTEGVPSFFDKDNTAARQAYADKAAAEPDTMTFLSPQFEKFRKGEVVFDCRFQCYLGYSNRKGDWKALHDKKAWRDLAVSVMNVGYQNDLSYFLLGEAAAGLGLKDAAQEYYRKAMEAQKAGYDCGSSCEGFDVRKMAASMP